MSLFYYAFVALTTTMDLSGIYSILNESRLTSSVKMIVSWPYAFTNFMVRNPPIESIVAFQNIFPPSRNKRPSAAVSEQWGYCQTTQAKGHILYTRLNNTQLMLYSPFRNLAANMQRFGAYEYMGRLKSNECTCTLQLRAFTGAVLKFPILWALVTL